MRPVVAVDVDITIVRSDLAWLSWLNHRSGKNLTLGDCCNDYNLSKYFPEVCDPFNFWRQEDMYDDLQPIAGSVRALKSLHEAGFAIVFVSYCKAKHFRSKYNFLKKHFPFMASFCATKEKQYIAADYFIDDRNSFLNKCVDGRKLIRYHTLYNQEEELIADARVFAYWPTIKNYILRGDL